MVCQNRFSRYVSLHESSYYFYGPHGMILLLPTAAILENFNGVTIKEVEMGNFNIYLVASQYNSFVQQYTALNHVPNNGVGTGEIMFKAAYLRMLTFHFLFVLAPLLSVSISFYDFGSKFHYFYANFKRARASNYCFQKECLKKYF